MQIDDYKIFGGVQAVQAVAERLQLRQLESHGTQDEKSLKDPGGQTQLPDEYIKLAGHVEHSDDEGPVQVEHVEWHIAQVEPSL